MSIELLHGDARELAAQVDQPIHCIITDPPYGVGHQSGFAQTEDGKKLTRKIANDEDPAVALELFYDVMTPLAARLTPNADLYIFTSWKVYPAWVEAVSLLDPAINVANTLVWDKGWPGLGDLVHNWALSFELIIYAKKGSRKIKNRRSSVLTYDRMATNKHIHPTEKPVELLMALLEQSTEPGDLVVDPFAGSGSTLAACERMGRRALGFEIDDEHYRRASERLSQPTFNFLQE